MKDEYNNHKDATKSIMRWMNLDFWLKNNVLHKIKGSFEFNFPYL